MLIFLIINLFILNAQCGRPLGVTIERASLYDLSKPFSCLDGSAVIPAELINDDYCDCRDGSDEPGTSACINGMFSCENLGYIVQNVPSSRVNDGICDCCDGSDENNNKRICENTCNVLAQKMRAEEEKHKLMLEIGINKRKELIEKGSELKKSIKAKLDELELKRVNAEIEKIKLEERKTSLESKAKELTDLQDKQFEEEAQKKAAEEKENNSNVLFTSFDLDSNGILSAEELSKRNELDILFDNDGHFTVEEAQRFLDHQTNVDMRIFFQQYYDKILPHLTNDNKDGNNNNSNNSEKEKVEENSDNVDYDQDNGEVNNGDSAAHEQHDTTQHEEHKQPEVIEPQVNKQKYDEQTTVLLDEAQKARDEFENAKRELSNIENDITNAKKKLEYDVGVSEEFMSMIDECFEFEDREYTYKLCPYERTVQISKANSGETSIGNWVSWGEEGQDKYKTMKFANGQSCWNGPARSTVVKLSCGIENKITSVSEPNRCEYEMKFETPSLCDPTNTQSTNSHLNHDEF